MNNKFFALIIAFIVIPFFGWMIYDSFSDTRSIQQERVTRDILEDGDTGGGAQIQYVFSFPIPTYIHNLNTSQIEQVSQTNGLAEHAHVYGLTQAGFKTGTHYEVNWSKKWFKDEYSMWVENMRVEFLYDTLNVYVTSAYSEGSCEYQATLNHENEHVEIHRRLYSQYQKKFREALSGNQTIPLSNRPIPATSIEEGKKKIGDLISAAIDPVFSQFQQDLQQNQAVIDTPESYGELKSRCSNW